jgi:hypothetical protein
LGFGTYPSYLYETFFNLLKTLKRIVVYLLATVILLAAALIGSVYFFQDTLIQRFVQEANKHLNTPVTIGKITVTALDEFPNLSIVFSDVYIEDSHPEKDTLLAAKRISFRLNPIDVWNEIYDVKGLKIEDSYTRLYVNAIGKINYDIIKPRGEGGGAAISFNLKDVTLSNARVSYADDETDLNHLFSGEDIIASIDVEGDMYHILATGDITTHHVGVSRRMFLVNKTFIADANVDYDDENKLVTINPSTLNLQEAVFDISGTYGFKEKNLIDLHADGKNTDIQTVLALLPSDFSKQFEEYESEGDVYFTAKVKGELSAQRDPLLSLTFGCTNATVHQPKFNTRITNANLEGSFATPSLSKLDDAEMFLKGIHGELNGKQFDADFSMRNFVHPYVNLVFKGDFEAQSIMQFYPIPDVDSISGTIRADISLTGDIDDLRKRETAQRVKTSGTLDLTDVNLVVGKRKIRISNFNGALQFNNNDISLTNASWRTGSSDFLLDGVFRNSMTFMLFDNQPIGIEADLKSSRLALDELLDIFYGEGETGNYIFSISPNVNLNFNCSIGALKYKRFSPANIRGNLLVKNQMAVVRNVTLNEFGGAFNLNGIIDARNPKAIEVVGAFGLEGTYLDSLFYGFKNFGQDFILDTHLKGQITADVTTEMTITGGLKLVPETLVADISAVIRNGELNNFEPLQALNRYLDDEGLARLRFADLRNEIHVENKTVHIPQMEIRSNVTHITLRGTHNFDQTIDYRVTAPLRSRKKIDPDESFGAVEIVNANEAQVFLKIIGTTDEYDVSYDKQELKKKVANEMKKEFQEMREAFKRKGKAKKKELELSEEEFDWDNP